MAKEETSKPKISQAEGAKLLDQWLTADAQLAEAKSTMATAAKKLYDALGSCEVTRKGQRLVIGLPPGKRKEGVQPEPCIRRPGAATAAHDFGG